MERALLSGNEAVALGAYLAGCRVAAAYPGTPSSEILPALARLGERTGADVYCEWSANEKVALEVAAGACLTGARALAAMKHVGVNVAADPLFTLAYTGVEGGLVLVSADDPGQHSSQNEQDNRYYARHAGVLLLEPSDSQEACEYTRAAFELSERFDLPAIVRLTTRISHSRSAVEWAWDREERAPEGARPNVAKHSMIPANARPRRLDLVRRLSAASEWAAECTLNRTDPGEGEIGFITSGLAYRTLREVLPTAPVLKLGFTYPLSERAIRAFADGFARVVVVEESEPFLHELISAVGVRVERLPDRLRVGELTPTRLKEGLRELGVDVAGRDAGATHTAGAIYVAGAAREDETTAGSATDLPSRPPVLCPGCSHRPVFLALRRLGVFTAGDIGCYALATLPPLGTHHTCLAMGAGISQAHGISKAMKGEQPVAAVIGDSTFAHAGLSALVNVAYNRGRAVTIILDNRTTAMTGGQDHPGTGRTLLGDEGPALDYAEVAKALGIEYVVDLPTDSLARVESEIRAALAYDGPSVLVARGSCRVRYRTRGAPVSVDSEACLRCGECFSLGCPAIGRDAGDADVPCLDASLCVGCGLCVEVCPGGALIAGVDADGH